MSRLKNPPSSLYGGSATALRRILPLLMVMLCHPTVQGSTQSIALKPGWNAVFLEVTPSVSPPAEVFSATPEITQVWAFFPTKSPIQYLSDPAAGLFNVPGWHVWMPPGSRPDAEALNNLHAVNGNQAYLIKNTASKEVVLKVEGMARHAKIIPLIVKNR